MKLLTRGGITIMVTGTILAGSAAWAVGVWRDGDEVAQSGSHEVARMVQKMKTVCVGRLLLDMPEDAQIELSGARIDGFNVSAFSEKSEDFRQRLARREAQLRAMPDRPGGIRTLEMEKAIEAESGIAGKMFVHSRTITEGTATNGLDIERYRYEGVAVEAMVHAKGLSVEPAADDYYPERVSNLPRLVEKLGLVAEGKLPAGSGFCIGQAHIKDPLSAEQGEEIIMLARLPAHPDIEFLLISAAGRKPAEQGLLKRNSDSKVHIPLSAKWRFTELRAKAREINGLSGEELVTRVREENDAKVYGFWWEVNGTRDNVLIPHLMFRMDTGQSRNGPVPSSISEEAALRLWDRIVSSIRVHTTVPSHQLALKETAAPTVTGTWAGSSCPPRG